MGPVGRLVRTLHTIRFLKPTQLIYRILRRVVHPRPDLRPAPGVRGQLGPVAFPHKASSLLGDGYFRFLNVSRNVSPEGFAARKGELLWDYNFHYFDGLNGIEPDSPEKWSFLRSWCEQVPPGSRPAWDPYPSSRRVVNWIKWSLATGKSPGWFLDSLAAQVRFLSKQLEYHLLANHLLANAVALAAAASYFDGPESEKLRQMAEPLLVEQLGEQFLEDGAHFELSTVYHALVLEDLLDLIQITEAVGARAWPDVRRRSESALRWLRGMTRPDGEVPLLNDAAYGIALTTKELERYAARLGIGLGASTVNGLRLFAPSGYFRYRHGRLHVIGDVGAPGPTYQPGHAHCDMLSFVLSWNGRPVIVDTGTSTYLVSERRSYERSTEAHNTVQLGDEQQSEIWAAFRMARRAQIVEVEQRTDSIFAKAKVFPPRWALHAREWRFSDESVTIVDHVERRSTRGSAKARFHLHPDVVVEGGADRWIVGPLRFDFRGADTVTLEQYDYAPEFNRRHQAACLTVSFDNSLTTRIT